MANKFSNWVKSLFAAGAIATGTSVMGAEAQENPEEVKETDKIENIQQVQSEEQKTDAPEIIDERNFLEKGMDWMGDKTKTVVNGAVDGINWTIDKTTELATGAVRKTGEGIEWTADKIGDKWVGPVVGGTLTNAADLTDKAVDNVLDTTGEAVKGATNIVTDTMSASARLATGKVGEAGETIVNSLTANTSNIVNTTLNNAGNIVNDTVGHTTNVATAVDPTGAVKTVTDYTNPIINSAVNNTTALAGQTINNALDITNTAGKGAANITQAGLDATATAVTGSPVQGARNFAGTVAGETIKTTASVRKNTTDVVLNALYHGTNVVSDTIHHGFVKPQTDLAVKAAVVGLNATALKDQPQTVKDDVAQLGQAAKLVPDLAKGASDAARTTLHIGGKVANAGLEKLERVAGDAANMIISGKVNTNNEIDTPTEKGLVEASEQIKEQVKNGVNDFFTGLGNQPSLNVPQPDIRNPETIVKAGEGIMQKTSQVSETAARGMLTTLKALEQIEATTDAAAKGAFEKAAQQKLSERQ